MNRITYKCYDQLCDVPDNIIKELRKLTNGEWGIMRPWIDERLDGKAFFTEHWMECGKVDFYSDLNIDVVSGFDNIIIAYFKGSPIGWAMADYDGMLNMYVKHNHRSRKVAYHLAYLWLSLMHKYRYVNLRQLDPYDYAHTDEATNILRAAQKDLLATLNPRKKYVHVLPKV